MLNVSKLAVTFHSKEGIVHAVKGIDFMLKKGQTLGIVGESGSGKSVTALALMGLLPATADVTGNVLFNEQSLLTLSNNEFQKIRGNEIGLIFQNPLAALNPVFTIANQMIETICLHHHVTKDEARKQAVELLDRVKIPNAKQRINDYPHQFSLGMCQRIMIAMTLSMKPTLLIADEPTASLDVTTQKEILELMDELKQDYNMTVILISHDLGVVAERCDEMIVMYLGDVMESGKPKQIFQNPKHDYTKKLINAIPKLDIRCEIR